MYWTGDSNLSLKWWWETCFFGSFGFNTWVDFYPLPGPNLCWVFWVRLVQDIILGKRSQFGTSLLTTEHENWTHSSLPTPASGRAAAKLWFLDQFVYLARQKLLIILLRLSWKKVLGQSLNYSCCMCVRFKFKLIWSSQHQEVFLSLPWFHAWPSSSRALLLVHGHIFTRRAQVGATTLLIASFRTTGGFTSKDPFWVSITRGKGKIRTKFVVSFSAGRSHAKDTRNFKFWVIPFNSVIIILWIGSLGTRTYNGPDI